MSGVIERYGRIDACFPNAGIGSGNKKPFIEQSTEDWFRVIDTNLHGVFYTLRAATRQMVKQGQGGSVIFTASGTAIQGMARGQAYAATKGAMISMMLAMSTEMPRYKITANAIIPGWVETGMTETSSNGKSLKTPSFRVSQCVAGVRQRTLAPLPST
jgi:NAD(P)-dependent dehydrogenase (short-subunit alcohol dehydrogenase family)